MKLQGFKHIDEFIDDVSKEEQLFEKFVPAKLEDLKSAMKKDEELKKFLNTPAKDLPQNYKFLVREITDDNSNKSLLYLIKSSLELHFKGTKTVPLFSVAGNKIIGFAAYIVDLEDNKVTEIKMFSFDPSKGSGSNLVRDLDNLLKDLIKQYEKVSWGAMKDNPANRIYKAAIKKYGGEIQERGDIIRYSIESKEKDKQKEVEVDGFTKEDGTKVESHTRSIPN